MVKMQQKKTIKILEFKNTNKKDNAVVTSVKWIMLVWSFIFMAFMLMMYYNAYGFSITPRKDDMINDRFKAFILCVLGGGMLAIAGMLLQKITRNNLAEINILGIGSINILFIFGYIMLFNKNFSIKPPYNYLLPIVTLLASLLGTAIVYIMSRFNTMNKNTFIIVGIALQFLFEALSVVFINPSAIGHNRSLVKIWSIIQDYTFGKIRIGNPDEPLTRNAVPWWLINTSAIISVIFITICYFIRKKIDIYEINEGLAISLGVRVEWLKFAIYFMVAIIAAMISSIVGVISLLGIVAPSIAKLLFNGKCKNMIVASFLIGAIMVMLAQFISVNLNTGLPPGILSTAIAVPYFIYLIIKGK